LIKATQNHQKSYADKRRRPLEFEVGDQVFLKVSLTKGIMRFCMVGKLSRRYIRLYPAVQRVGKVAYRLEIPQELPIVHNIFHVS